MLDKSSDTFTLNANQISEGHGYTPVELTVGDVHDARVGQLFVNGTTTAGPATSWYRFTSGGGSYKIEAFDYPQDAGSGTGGLKLQVFEGSAGQENVNDLNALTDLGFQNPDGSTATSITASPASGKTVFVLVTNLYTDYHRSNFRPDAGWVDFKLRVTQQ